MNKLFFISLFSICLISIYSTASKTYNVSPSELNAIASKFGSSGVSRVESWDAMIEASKNEKILIKLKNVNDFFNQLRYKTDQSNWFKKDYWATPFEFMGKGAGDCEDYAIAKYFTLIKLGVPDDKLRITYVIYKKFNSTYEEAHMVLTYTHKPGVTPVVLDNINKKLDLATNRRDLSPVYSFNASGLWQAKNKGESRVGSNNLKSWKDLVNRI